MATDRAREQQHRERERPTWVARKRYGQVDGDGVRGPGTVVEAAQPHVQDAGTNSGPELAGCPRRYFCRGR